jgi:dihydropteroate synthase
MSRLAFIPVPGEGGHGAPALLAVADSADAASAAVSAGADIIDLGSAAEADIAAFRAGYPEAAFCAADHRAAVTRQADSARASGAVLICDDLTAARASGLAADRLVVQTGPTGIAAVRLAGYAAMVDVDQASMADVTIATGAGGADGAALAMDLADAAGSVAAAAISSWLGAALIRTRHPLRIKRGLDMTAAIQGIRPPARTVRGLA